MKALGWLKAYSGDICVRVVSSFELKALGWLKAYSGDTCIRVVSSFEMERSKPVLELVIIFVFFSRASHPHSLR